ncbi:MAG: hypothetical protein R3Y09_11035 [Clostridia bacterium]
MKKFLVTILLFALAFSGGIFVGGYTVNSKWEDKIELQEHIESFDDFDENFAENTDENFLETSNIDWQGDELYAVLFLGYGLEIYDYQEYIDVYFDENSQIQQAYQFDGDENYLVIPRYPEKATKIVKYELVGDDFETGDTIYEIKDKNHFVIKCNVSDLYPNIVIQTETDDELFEFSPRISLENGEIVEDERILILKTVENKQK